HANSDRDLRTRLHSALRARALQNARCSPHCQHRRLQAMVEVQIAGSGGFPKMTSAAASKSPQRPGRGRWRRYLFTTDHKAIGIQYFFLSLAAVLIGAVLSALMRIHLVWPKAAPMKPETYLSLLTMHGTLMVFFVLSTVPQNGFGTYFLPLQ